MSEIVASVATGMPDMLYTVTRSPEEVCHVGRTIISNMVGGQQSGIATRELYVAACGVETCVDIVYVDEGCF